MRSAAAFSLLFACFAIGQENPPAEVDEALRARVTEFFGYHVKGEFRKAMNLVAQETQDEYFAAQKTRYEEFKIDSIRYMENFTKAVVSLTVKEKKRLSIQFPDTVFVEPTSVLWKLEDGKWCFYIDHKSNWMLAMGPSDPKAVEQARNGTGQPPPPLSPEKLQQMAGAILGQSSISRNDLQFPPDRPTVEEIVFTNGQAGSVKIAMSPMKVPDGMTVELDKTEVPMNGKATIKVSYNPKPNVTPPTLIMNLVMEPFSRNFPISVRFISAQ